MHSRYGISNPCPQVPAARPCKGDCPSDADPRHSVTLTSMWAFCGWLFVAACGRWCHSPVSFLPGRTDGQMVHKPLSAPCLPESAALDCPRPLALRLTPCPGSLRHLLPEGPVIPSLAGYPWSLAAPRPAPPGCCMQAFASMCLACSGHYVFVYAQSLECQHDSSLRGVSLIYTGLPGSW